MKNLLLAVFAAPFLIFSCQTDMDPGHLKGYWQSTTDEKYQVKIDDAQFINLYDGKLMSASAYKFHPACPASCGAQAAKPCLVTSGDRETCFSILKADGEALEIFSTIGNGQPLLFTKTTAFEIPEPKPEPAGPLCFKNTDNGGDVTSLQLSVSGEKATGFLIIQLADGHSGVGTLAGTLADGVIFADYSYRIEGSNQIEEVAFKFDGDNLLQGTSPLKEEGEKLVFEDKLNIEYKLMLAPVACETIAEQVGWAEEME